MSLVLEEEEEEEEEEDVQHVTRANLLWWARGRHVAVGCIAVEDLLERVLVLCGGVRRQKACGGESQENVTMMLYGCEQCLYEQLM